MTLWAGFFDYILPEVPGVHQDLVTLHVRSVTIDFCTRTGIYEDTLAEIPLVDGTHSYTPTMPSGYEMARIVKMWHDQRQIFPRSVDQLSYMYLNWETVEGPPTFYTQEDTSTFRLVPIPDDDFDEGITVRVALTPTRASTGVADWIFADWVETIADGVKARLMRMPTVPYTNLALADYYRKCYESGCADAQGAAMKSNTRAPLQVMMQVI